MKKRDCALVNQTQFLPYCVSLSVSIVGVRLLLPIGYKPQEPTLMLH